MDLQHQLTPRLKRLRLSGILDTLDVRNQQAIAHLNTLTYVLIDLRARHRLVEQRADNQQAA